MSDARSRIELRRRRFYERLTLFRAVNAVAALAVALTLGAALLERLIEPDTFGSVGAASWWAIATVSTTGYGDAVPVTVPGKLVAAVVMVGSVALVPAVTAIVTTLLVRKHEHELGRTEPALVLDARLDEIVERLERIERSLGGTPSAGRAPALNGRPAPRATAPPRPHRR